MLALTFLTPVGGLFVLTAAVPLAALAVTERRSQAVRRIFAVAGPRRRGLVPVVVALVALPALVGVAAAQPIVVHQKVLSERADAEAFFVFDTSLSMSARSSPNTPTRLMRAKHEALRLQEALADVPVGIASMTDRALPDLMPTTDLALFRRTLSASVGINEPPPSQAYQKRRASTLEALVPVLQSHFFSAPVPHRLIVVWTDGESHPLSSAVRYVLQPTPGVTALFVHVWSPTERIFLANGKADPNYRPDPTSNAFVDSFSRIVRGQDFTESQFGQLASAAQASAGRTGTTRRVETYARIALAPWFLLAGAIPLAFLLWRRNL
jgi:hypothetical protein